MCYFARRITNDCRERKKTFAPGGIFEFWSYIVLNIQYEYQFILPVFKSLLFVVLVQASSENFSPTIFFHVHSSLLCDLLFGSWWFYVVCRINVIFSPHSAHTRIYFGLNSQRKWLIFVSSTSRYGFFAFSISVHFSAFFFFA